MKQCSKCKEVKDISLFAKSKTAKYGIHSWCKQCMTDKVLEYRGGRVFELVRKNSTHKECRSCKEIKIPLGSKKSYCSECTSLKNHKRNIKLKYGISLDQYEAILLDQDYKCKICREKDKKRLSVDHDHNCCPGGYTCGKCIRGLLCHRCNIVLGQIKESNYILNSMLKYLST